MINKITKCPGKLVFLTICSVLLVACSNGPFSHLPFHQTESFSDSLMMDTNAIALYPNNIEMYNLNSLPNKPYKVIDNFKVSIYNENGLKLQRAKLKTYLQVEAAKLGGDGVIELGVRGRFDYAEAIKFMPATK